VKKLKFEEVHPLFISHHLAKRSGERKGRLDRGHGHGEVMFLKNVWWPLKGHFEDLHPEYEVLDWRGRSYFADFVFSPKTWKLLIEVKGFGEHVTNMDRQKYCNELNRETFLSGLGFHIISFAYDDVAYRAELCVYLLGIVLSRYESSISKVKRINFADHEILRYTVCLARPIRPIDVSDHFTIDHRTAVLHLKRLCQKGWLKPIIRGKGQRILYYEVTKHGLDSGLWGN